MSSLIRSDVEVANPVEVGSIFTKVAGDELEEKVEKIEKIEEDSDFIPEDAVVINKTVEGYTDRYKNIYDKLKILP